MTVADLLPSTSDAPPSSATNSGRLTARRTVGRGRSLPTGRAMLGALLVTLSGVGLYLASIKATASPRSAVVVAATDIAPDHELTREDLTVIQVRLDDRLRLRTFVNPADLIGTKTLGPIGKGELIQGGAVVAVASGSTGREMSFAIPLSRAVAGRLRAGERVDVVATTGSGTSAVTKVVVTSGLVIEISDPALAASDDDVVVVLSIRDVAEQLALAEAMNEAKMVLVRADPADGADPDAITASVTATTVPATTEVAE